MKFADLREGDRLFPDAGFDCMATNVEVIVHIRPDGTKYVPCACGEHDLDGQRDLDDGETIVGLSPEPWPDELV